MPALSISTFTEPADSLQGSYARRARTHESYTYVLHTSFLAGSETRPDRSKPSNGGTAGAWASPYGDAVLRMVRRTKTEGGEERVRTRAMGDPGTLPRNVQKLPRTCCSDPTEKRSDSIEEQSQIAEQLSKISNRTESGNMCVLVGLLKAVGRSYRKKGHRQAARDWRKGRTAPVPLMQRVFSLSGTSSTASEAGFCQQQLSTWTRDCQCDESVGECP